MSEQKKLEAGGFIFSDEVVAEKAKKEINAVSYLRNQLSHMNAAQILEAYRGLIDKNVFDTAVGYSFLKELQRTLIADSTVDNADIPLIPVADERALKDTENETMKLKWQRKFHMLLPFTILLLGCVIFMFVLTATSNNMTILDYKEKVENQYADWDESLTKREDEVKEREEKLLEDEERLKNGENSNGSEKNTNSR
ncbi:MAG: hypothetical protein PUF16_01235 [Lachnospiraceae bacterium]|nr:hypothetical protein [Lachnospiraceae bacterium]